MTPEDMHAYSDRCVAPAYTMHMHLHIKATPSSHPTPHDSTPDNSLREIIDWGVRNTRPHEPSKGPLQSFAEDWPLVPGPVRRGIRSSQRNFVDVTARRQRVLDERMRATRERIERGLQKKGACVRWPLEGKGGILVLYLFYYLSFVAGSTTFPHIRIHTSQASSWRTTCTITTVTPWARARSTRAGSSASRKSASAFRTPVGASPVRCVALMMIDVVSGGQTDT